MDPEQTFIRVQERFAQFLTPRLRAALEYISLFLAVNLFCILVVMHANYVQQVTFHLMYCLLLLLSLSSPCFRAAGSKFLVSLVLVSSQCFQMGLVGFPDTFCLIELEFFIN